MPVPVEEEVLLALALAPVQFMDFRARLSPTISCSDASETGLGVSFSAGLTTAGREALRTLPATERLEARGGQAVLAVGLFDGIGALHQALEILNVLPVGRVGVECRPEANRVSATAWSGIAHHLDARTFGRPEVEALKRRFTGVRCIFLGGGFPCGEWSARNPLRRGLDGASGDLVFEVVRTWQLFEEVFPGALVALLGKNVASMGQDSAKLLADIIGLRPVLVDSKFMSWCHRPRLFFLNFPLEASADPVAAASSGTATEAWDVVRLAATRVPWKTWVTKGWSPVDPHVVWPTMVGCKPRGPAAGRAVREAGREDEETIARWAADGRRHPVAQFRRCHCVCNSRGVLRALDAGKRGGIMGFRGATPHQP